MELSAKDTYLDRVQLAVENHPHWSVDDILHHVFRQWASQDPEDFIYGVKEDMKKAESAPPRNAYENRTR